MCSSYGLSRKEKVKVAPGSFCSALLRQSCRIRLPDRAGGSHCHHNTPRRPRRLRARCFGAARLVLTSGEGNLGGIFPSGVLFSSLSPRMSLRCWAMTRCCSTLQWFSMDRMTGYSDTWERGRGGGSELFNSIITGGKAIPRHTPVGSTEADRGRMLTEWQTDAKTPCGTQVNLVQDTLF